MTLRHLRSSTADKRPQASGMAEGQLAINTASGSPGLFFKDSAGNLVKVGPVHVGSGAPNASPASGGTAGNSLGEQWLDTSGGTYVFKVWDGAAWRSEAGEFVNTTGDTMTGALGIIAGSASTPGLFFSGDANSGLYSPGADQVAISTGGSGRLFVDASGNIGVGTATTNWSLLDGLIVQTGNGYAGINIASSSATDNAYLAFGYGTTAAEQFSASVGRVGNNTLVFGTNNTERLRITSAGLVGVGTSSPSNTLHVVGTGRFNVSGANNAVLASDGGDPFFYTEQAAGLKFGTNSAVRMTINSSGSVGVGTTTVDKLLTLNDTSGATLALKTGANTSSSIHGLEFYDRQGTASFPSSPGQLTSYVRSERNGGNAEFSLTFGTTNSTSANASERLRIDSSGRVGIGTSSPTQALSIGGSGGTLSGTAAVTLFDNNSNGSRRWSISNGAGGNTVDLIGKLVFSYGNGSSTADPMAGIAAAVIDSSGRVGIGTTNVPAPFCVSRSGNEGLEVTPLTGNQVEIQGYNRTTSNWVAALNKFSQHIWNLNSTTEAARIDTSGRLLVGTSSAPSGGDYSQYSKLVNIGNTFGSGYAGILTLGVDSISSLSAGDDVGVIVFTNRTGNEYARILCEADATTGSGDYPGRLVFSTTADGASSPTERMRITSGGNALIGCQALPSASVEGFVATGTSSGNRTSSGASTSAYNHWLFYNGNGVVGSISTSGSATTYATSSDYRLKENVAAVTDGIARLQQLKPSRFNFIADPSKTVDGFIAHEVQAVVPEAITGAKDEVDADGKPVYQGIDQSKLVPLLTAALQEAVAKIESLEARLTAAGI